MMMIIIMVIIGEAVTDGADEIQSTCRTTAALQCPGCAAALHIVAVWTALSLREHMAADSLQHHRHARLHTCVASSRAAILSAVA